MSNETATRTSDLAALTPSEVDLRLAELDLQAGRAEQTVATALVTIHDVLGHRRPRSYGRVGRFSPAEDQAAVAEIRTRAAAGERASLSYSARPLAEFLDRYDQAVALTAAIEAQAAPLNAEYARRPWSRFFLVQQHNGHIHGSKSCSTCNNGRQATSFAWNPHLSGLTQDEAISQLGRWASSLCTVCFPDAPVERTDGRLLAAGYCPGGRHVDGTATPPRGYGGTRYGECPTCHQQVPINADLNVRKHKPAKVKETS